MRVRVRARCEGDPLGLSRDEEVGQLGLLLGVVLDLAYGLPQLSLLALERSSVALGGAPLLERGLLEVVVRDRELLSRHLRWRCEVVMRGGGARWWCEVVVRGGGARYGEAASP
jgi:hypothetical protein